MADEQSAFADDPFIRAGEYALGVLEGEELNQAREAMLRDRAFAGAVEWWEWRLGTMAEAVEAHTPSAGVWNGILARVRQQAEGAGIPVQMETTRAAPAGWSIATAVAGAGLAAAGLAFFLATPTVVDQPTPTVAAAPGPQLVAQLQDEEAGRKLVSAIDVTTGRLNLNVTGLEAEPGQTPELWVIPEGGAPVSLGYIPQSGEFTRELADTERALVVAGSTLAVTFEEDTGERHTVPTMPILLLGALDLV